MEKNKNVYIDYRFGFPVQLVGFPMRTIRGKQTPSINGKLLRYMVLATVAKKKGSLNGLEVRLIRTSQEKTLQEFAKILGVSHAAVHKWERQEEKPTNMASSTEQLIRLSVFEHLPDEFIDRCVETEHLGKQLRDILEEIRRSTFADLPEPLPLTVEHEELKRLSVH